MDRNTGTGKGVIWLNFLIVACVCVAYSNSLTNGYAYDDYSTVLQNPNIRSFSNLASSLNIYRPIRWLTFTLDYHFWKLNPIGYHLSNVFLHAVCGLLVFYVAKLLMKDTFGSLIASVLFCAHPICTEAVDNISNRGELLGTLFGLSAFYCYIKSKESRRWLLAVFVLFVIALLSKEVIAVSLPLLFITYELYFNRSRDGKLRLPRIVPLFAFLGVTIVAIGYAIIVLHIGSRVRDTFLFLSANTFAHSNAVLIDASIWVRAMAKGVLLVLYPKTLSADYPIPHISAVVDTAFMGSFIVVFVFVLAVIRTAKRSRTASFGLLWILVFLLPVSNIVPITLHFMADRYLYTPSIGFCLFVSVVLTAVYRKGIRICGSRAQKKSVLSVLLVLLVMFIVGDWRRNRDWKSDHTIWARTSSQQPDSPLAHSNFGVQLLRVGRIPEAIKEFETTITICDKYNIRLSGNDAKKREPSRTMREISASAHDNMGVSYMKLKMYKEAEREFKTAISIAPAFYGPSYNLGMLHLTEGDIDTAIDALTRSIQIDDSHAEVHRALGHAFEKKGMLLEARTEYANAMKLIRESVSE